MTCCFSGEEVPTEKLFVLYYPPSMAHHGWDQSVYAAAHAKHALAAAVDGLKSFHGRYVVGKDLWPGVAAAVTGLALFAIWLATSVPQWLSVGFAQKFLLPFVALIVTAVGFQRLRAFLRRNRLWKNSGRQVVDEEIRALKAAIAELPEDPTAEEAAVVMRRPCPDVLSELAFQGTYFRAFTYLDFVMYPQLSHPTRQEELPSGHNLNRDAYYVGNIVYDGWRMFQRDRRDFSDPRFAGSGGRRGVI
jgi:hypothetical protein